MRSTTSSPPATFTRKVAAPARTLADHRSARRPHGGDRARPPPPQTRRVDGMAPSFWRESPLSPPPADAPPAPPSTPNTSPASPSPTPSSPAPSHPVSSHSPQKPRSTSARDSSTTGHTTRPQGVQARSNSTASTCPSSRSISKRAAERRSTPSCGRMRMGPCSNPPLGKSFLAASSNYQRFRSDHTHFDPADDPDQGNATTEHQPNKPQAAPVPAHTKTSDGTPGPAALPTPSSTPAPATAQQQRQLKFRFDPNLQPVLFPSEDTLTEGTDAWALVKGYVSVTPLRAEYNCVPVAQFGSELHL